MNKIVMMLMLLFAGTASAEDTVILVHGDGSATVVTLTPNGGASRTTVSAERVIQAGAPAPNPKPNPGEPKTLREKMAVWFVDVKDADKTDNARKIAAVYQVVGQEAGNGKFENANEVGPAVGRLTDIVLGSNKDAWDEFRSKLGAELTELGKAGKLSTNEDIERVLTGIADDLDKVATGGLSGVDKARSDVAVSGIVELILRLLPLILEIIRGLR